jgi:hypothetical protein
VPLLFGVTLFVSATLLFLVQPMVGKMILPLLGGTPAVWNTCMVFFQALLLAGYYYAHKTSSGLTAPRQVRVHSLLLLLTLGVLALGAAFVENHSPVPVIKSLAPQGSDIPFFGVLLLLAAAIGLPFFTISTTAPLLQKWFSETGHPSAKDPYFLYAASNFGSLLALLAYPFVVEPYLRLVEQAWMWAAGFAILAGLILVCGQAVRNVPPPRTPSANDKQAPAVDEPAPHWYTRLRWLALAAVPSSLMLAVTTSVTTDMVSMPLLWIIPLSLYLTTFIIVFAKSTPSWVHQGSTLITPVLILLVVFIKVAEKGFDFANTATFVQYGINLLPFVTFFFVALTCHGELARTRPAARHLTGFYLTMSLGGVIGGLFNALFAPMVFTFITEYPITLVAACCLIPPLTALINPAAFAQRKIWSFWDFVVPILFFAAGRFLSAYYVEIESACESLIDRTGVKLGANFLATTLALGVPVLCSYFLVDRPLRFGLAVGGIWLGTFMTSHVRERDRPEHLKIYHTRSFFGAMKIEPFRTHVRFEDGSYDHSPLFSRLIHGTTVHGMQIKDPDNPSHAFAPDNLSHAQALQLLGANCPLDALALAWIAEPHLNFPGREPLTYYHRTGPVGMMFREFWNQNVRSPRRNTDVACIGLGTGTSSCYARRGEKMTFFEIDPTVRRLVDRDIGQPEAPFTYIQRAREQGSTIEFVMGDARLSLEQTNRKWGLMLVDAFSSDSIPAHLLTLQAVQLYFDRLEDDGLLALHISNRYLKLEPVVDQIVRKLGYQSVVMHDSVFEPYRHQQEFSGKLSSSWVLVAKRREAFGDLFDDYRWVPLKHDDSVGLWTDDYTPITKALNEGWWTLFGR